MTTFLEAQEGISKAWSCPICAALVIERRDHRDWHVRLWSVADDGLTRYDRVALDDWADDDPKERKAV